jgi:molybdopterin/thiamine biosynthesis adenylyltransferase
LPKECPELRRIIEEIEIVCCENDIIPDRYQRNVRIPGVEAIAKLLKFTWLLLELELLERPPERYLPGWAVGTLIVADRNVLEKSNLNRQVLFIERSAGLLCI